MANLNGLLGGSRMPSFLGGLLGDEEEYRRLQQQAQSSSLGDMASAFYKAGAPSRVPGGSTLQAINEGMMAQESGYKRSMNEQLQEKIAQQKMRQEMMARDRQAKAQVLSPQLIGQATRPETPLMDNYGIEQAGPNMPRAGGFDQNVLNKLLGLGAEGQKVFMDRLAIQKAMQGDTTTLAPDASLIRTNLDGTVQTLATGKPKPTESALDKKILSADALALMQSAFKTRNFADLTPSQQQTMMRYENAPSEEAVAKLRGEYAKVGYDTPGFNAQVPLSKNQIANQIFSSATQQNQTTPQRSQTQSPVVNRPFTRDAGGGVQITPEFAQTSMGEREVPLIQSAALSLKDKRDLLVAKPKTTQAVETSLNSNRRLKRALIQLRDNPGMASAFGFTGEFVSGISGTDAANAKAILEQIEGKAFITAIGDMRAASATGAAVGSVTEQEGAKLQRSFTTLKQSQSPNAAKQEIDNMINVLNESESITKNAYARTYGQPNFNLIDGGQQSFKATLSNGKTVVFPNQESLNQFKEATGLK